MAKKKKKYFNERVERYVITADDDSVWTPCYERNRIKLFVSLNYFDYYYVKIAAWGADDYGVERVYRFEQDEKAAREKYVELLEEMNNIEDGITCMELLNRGFEPF